MRLAGNHYLPHGWKDEWEERKLAPIRSQPISADHRGKQEYSEVLNPFVFKIALVSKSKYCSLIVWSILPVHHASNVAVLETFNHLVGV